MNAWHFDFEWGKPPKFGSKPERSIIRNLVGSDAQGSPSWSITLEKQYEDTFRDKWIEKQIMARRLLELRSDGLYPYHDQAVVLQAIKEYKDYIATVVRDIENKGVFYVKSNLKYPTSFFVLGEMKAILDEFFEPEFLEDIKKDG